MARNIVVTLGDSESTFSITKLDRKKLYGARKRQALDDTGESCQRASLTQDGRYLLVPGMTAQGYYNEAGTWIPSADIQGVDLEGNPIEKLPSTLGKPQALTKVGPKDVLDLRVGSVYQLEATEVDDALKAALSAGDMFSLPLGHRAGFERDTAILLENPNGLFLLTGKPTPPEWVEPAAAVVIADDEEDDDLDDLDFEMF